MPLAIFSIAFALIEAAVVVYLRKLYYPDGFSLPLSPLQREMIFTETMREAATLVVIASVSILSDKVWAKRWCYFIFSFALWDIFYYVWLKFFIDWPESLFAPDILFLIPVIWWGPVLAPLIVASTLSAGSSLYLYRLESGSRPTMGAAYIVGLLFAITIILYTFMVDATILESGKMPPPFRWLLFASGELIAIGTLVKMLFMERK